MLRALVLLLALFFAAPVIASEPNMDTELHTALEYLATVPSEDRSSIKFFTTFAVPEELRDQSVLVLSFWIHSLTGPTLDGSGNLGYYKPLAQIVPTANIPEGDSKEKVPVDIERKFVPFKSVPGSDTLWWLDIRDHNWTEQAFEKVSQVEPHFRKPWITPAYDNLRHNGGNSIIRADWFLMHTADTTRQADRNQTPLYYELLYASVGVPKTVAEYHKIWDIDIERAQRHGLARASVVEKGQSIVSRHARELVRLRTGRGYHWETSDVKNMDNENDFLENLDIQRDAQGIPRHFGLARRADAHEYITTNGHGMQVYFLANDKEERIEFADSTIVVDTKDKNGDVRVRTARSCVVCHAQGINPTLNELKRVIGEGVNLNATFKDYGQVVERYYLSDLNSDESDDQIIYRRAMSAVNGLTPEENTKFFEEILNWYDRDVTLEQAARECGVTVEQFKKECGVSTSVRLARLCKNGHAVPREIWENPKGGVFAQAMLLLTKSQAIVVEEVPAAKNVVVVSEGCVLKTGNSELGRVPFGTKLQVLKVNEDNLWYLVEYNGQRGYVKISETKELE